MPRLVCAFVVCKPQKTGFLPLAQMVFWVPDHMLWLRAKRNVEVKLVNWSPQFPIFLPFKGIYLSKALTCMKLFLYKQKLLFYHGEGYLWPHCCMNNLYSSHRSLYTPRYCFSAVGSMLISLFRVTSWFDTVCNIVTRWVNFKKKNSCINMNYNYLTTIFRSIFTQMYKFLVEKYIFTIFPYELFKVKMKNL